MGVKGARVLSWLKPALEIVVGGGLLIAIIAWLSGAFEVKIAPGQQEAAHARHVSGPVDQVHEVHKQYIEEAVGTLKAASRSVISAQLLAKVVAVHVTAGDDVEAGKVLVELDRQEYEARQQQAQAGLKGAEANRKEATQAFDRAVRLRSSNAISQQDFDQAQRNVQVSEAEERRAQQALAEADVMLSYTTIIAPRAGRIVDRLAEPGDMARPGVPLLILYDASSLRLEAPVLEQLAVTLRVGQKVKVYVDSLQREVTATLDEIVPQADAPSRSFLVKATVPKSDDLYEGMFGRLRIPAGSRRHLCLNTAAIERVGQLEFVNVVRPDHTTERRYIKTGRIGMPGRVEVLSGLEAGESVELLREDEALQPKTADTNGTSETSQSNPPTSTPAPEVDGQ